PIDHRVSLRFIMPSGLGQPEKASSVVRRTSSANALETEAGGGREGSTRRTYDERRTTKSRHRVLGEEAARRSDWTDLENVVVDVEITDWPTATQNPRGRVIEILGYEDDFGVDVEIMIRKFYLPHRFPDEVLHEAEVIEPIISSAELRKRRDFRALLI